jgi:HK97 family phage major capsid protein
MDIKKQDLTNSKRAFKLDIKAEAFIPEERTVEISFSSEEPYQRYWGIEILGHGEGEINFERLNDSAPLLLQHNHDDQIGVVERVWIEEGRGKALIRFGKGELSSEIYQDVIDSIRRNVSVGYQINEYKLIEEKEGEGTYRVTSWTPFEISIVSVPADQSVGVGRKLEDEAEEQKQLKQQQEEVKKMAEETKPIVTPDFTEAKELAVKEARESETKRSGEILALGVEHKQAEQAQVFVKEGKSVEEFKSLLLSEKGKAEPMPTETDLGLGKKEIEKYSLKKALVALETGDWSKAQYEKEVSDAIGELRGESAKGIFLPMQDAQRNLTVGDDTAGGYTVDTQLGNMIELLRNKMVVNAMGATVLSGLRGNVSLPKHTGAATGYWVNEDGNVTESQQTFGQVNLTPKTVGAMTDISRRLMLQSEQVIEQVVINDLSTVLALSIDLAAIQGTGANGQPLGIVNTTGIKTQSFASASDPTWGEILGMEGELNTANALMGTLGYLTTPAVKANMQAKSKDTGSGQFVWPEGKTVNAYNAMSSPQMVAAKVLFGNWADLIIGNWGTLDINLDKSTNSASGGLRIVALQDVDVAIKHPESFCLGSN